MFEYFVNPADFLQNSRHTISETELTKISEIADSLWEQDDDVKGLLLTYDDPFWYIGAKASKHKIGLEIHSDVSILDARWLENRFSETVRKALLIRMERRYATLGKDGGL